MTISPDKGTMFDTQFEIAMSGYTTTDKMKYILFGIAPEDEQEEPFQLDTGFLEEDGSTTIKDKQLPVLIKIKAVIIEQDADG